MSQADNIVTAAGLHKSYSLGATPVEVLKGVDLMVRRGEALAIVGASGAGKSTLLHLLGGLDTPTLGLVELDGMSLYDLPSSRRAQIRNEKVGFVFQAY